MKCCFLFITVSALLLCSGVARGGGTTVWETSTSDDFNAGELSGVVVFSPGGVRIGPVFDKIEVKESAIWCVIDVPGRGLHFGTAKGGSVYRLVGSKAEKILESEEEDLIISALVADEDQTVYAAVVPGGKIYRIPPSGKPAVIRLPDPYVWALDFDTSGNLLAATGPKGKLYRVDKGGGWVKEVFASENEKNLLSLAVGPEGTIFCGSAETGILYRISPDGKVGAVHDFKEREVRAILYGKDGLIVGTNTPKKGFDQVSFVGGMSGTLNREEWGSGSRQNVMKKLMGAALYKIDPDGRVETLAQFEKTYMLAAARGGDGKIYVATADSGRVFSVDGDRRVSTVVDLEEERVLSLARGATFPLAVGAGGPGHLYTLRKAGESGGVYVSQVHDACFPSRWGRVSWSGRGQVALSFRSGHTEKPDRTWSTWSSPLRTSGATLPAPRGRYLQYRIEFGSDPSAVVTRVRVNYVSQNHRPVVSEITVGTPPPKETYPLFNPKRETVLKIQAKAEDPNGDALVFRFFFRREGSQGWIPMGEEPLEKPEFSWQTADLPDGLYEVRAVASDERVNPDPLTGERISRPVPIDNHRPVIEDLAVADGKILQVRGIALDRGSVITRVEYRINGDPWAPMHPSDGVFDSREEPFEFPLPTLISGTHRLWVRAFDRAGNAGVAMIEFKVD
ncbi:MAG: SMP-30/gluconolactonase/LRE family protein [Planctomycetota bacterium]|jgi:sugar lactone lactonase YvrE